MLDATKNISYMTAATEIPDARIETQGDTHTVATF